MIALLSEQSVKSEMLEGGLRLAHTGGQPVILAVRVDYCEPFLNPLDIYLNRRNWALWNDPQDTPTLLADLEPVPPVGATRTKTDRSDAVGAARP